MVRCEICGHRYRVLSEEILPQKTYSLPAIEKGGRLYTHPDPSGPGLRKVVEGMGEDRPAHSTLHRWLSGLGERSLDRLPTEIPTSALIAETAKGLDARVRRLWQRHFPIPSWKFKSRKRADELEACARVLHIAATLFPKSPHPLTTWQGWLIGRFHVTAWAFPTGECCTPMQLTPPPRRGVGGSTRSKKERKRVPEKARSPPRRLLAVPTD